DIAAVRLHDAGVDGVPQLQLQDAVQLFGNVRVADAHAHLDAALGVSGQKVAGGNVDAHVRAGAEAVNAGVLQVAAHQAADVDVPGPARHTGPHAADAADDHIHPHAGAAGLAELGDDPRVV